MLHKKDMTVKERKAHYGAQTKKNSTQKNESKQRLRNQTSDPRLVELVKLLARGAAEHDYEKILSQSACHPANDNEEGSSS